MSNKEAIAVLEARLAELERKSNALIQVINDLRAEDGLPPRGRSKLGSANLKPGSASSDLIQAAIKPDIFQGKKLQTAVREYLTMRKLGDAGPATPREIYDGIIKGGFKFGVKGDAEAFERLRTLLRKRAAFFHKLPNGTYGMTAWYARAKMQREKSAPAGKKLAGKAEAADKPTTLARPEPKGSPSVQAEAKPAAGRVESAAGTADKLQARKTG